MNPNVELVDLGPCKKQLRFELPVEDVDAAFEDMAKQFQKQANLPGYRKGKAPIPKIAAHFAEEIAKEVQQRLTNECFQKGLEEHDLTPALSPAPEELHLRVGEPMTFLTTLEVVPNFELPNYKGLPAEAPRVEITEEKVENAINSVRRDYAQREDRDKPVEDNDYVVISFTGTHNGEPLTTLAPTARGLSEQQGMPLHVHADGEHDHFIPGFTKQLLGAKAGDALDIKVTIPDEFPTQPKLQGLDVDFKVTVDKVQEEVLPELTDEFAKQFEVDNVQGLRDKARNALEDNAKGQNQQKITREVHSALMDQLSFEVPDTPRQQEMHGLVSQIVRMRRANGESEEDIENAKDQITADANADALAQLRWRYACQRIAKEEKIQVTDEEIARTAIMQAQQSNADPKAAYEELRDNPQMQDYWRMNILSQKVLSFLAENADITETEPEEDHDDEHSHGHSHG